MINRGTSAIKKSPECQFSESDIEAFKLVKKITDKGNDAEVRKSKDGTLSVYTVTKKKENR